jgi:hypothetical protein
MAIVQEYKERHLKEIAYTRITTLGLINTISIHYNITLGVIIVSINYSTILGVLNAKIPQNYWVFGLCPSTGILGTRKHDVSETGSVSVLRWG